jgi:hypothetical protein
MDGIIPPYMSKAIEDYYEKELKKLDVSGGTQERMSAQERLEAQRASMASAEETRQTKLSPQGVSRQRL